MKKRHRLITVLTVLMLAFGGALASAPAQAAGDESAISQAGWELRPIGEGFHSCPNFTFCVWADANARGDRIGFTGNLICKEIYPLRNVGLQDRVTSLVNSTTVTISLMDTTLTGTWYELAPAGQGWGGNIHSSINDKADGIAWWRC